MKKLKLIIFVLFLLQINSKSFSQEVTEEYYNKVNLGLGMGLDYGGFGGKFNFIPAKHLALFGGVGTNIVDIGYNFGGTFLIYPDKRICPTISAMYGYNAVIKVVGASNFNEVYYGPSFALGLDMHSKRNGKNFFTLELLIPIRSQDFPDRMEYLEDYENIEFKTKPLPIALSFGYHFGM